MADAFNTWDGLARHCGVDPDNREKRNALKAHAYRLILGLENDISVQDTQILQFLRENHLAIMANMVRDNQVTEAMREETKHD